MKHTITVRSFEGFEALSLLASAADRRIHSVVIPSKGMAYYRVTLGKDEFRDFPIDEFQKAIHYYNT